MKNSIDELDVIFKEDEELVNHLSKIDLNQKETYDNTFENFSLIKELIPKSKKYL
jgi:hypothetical protein